MRPPRDLRPFPDGGFAASMDGRTAIGVDDGSAPARPAVEVGYVIAIAMNAVGLWVTRRLLEWGWPRFLTDDFEQLLPILTVSFVAGMVVNALFVVADPPRFKALCNVVTSVISLVVAVRTWQVFPFDFSSTRSTGPGWHGSSSSSPRSARASPWSPT